MDTELLKYVLEELDYIAGQWRHDMEDVAIRKVSTSLRSLLIENKVQLAWKTIGFTKQIRVMAPSLDSILKRPDVDRIQFAEAGGGASHGFTIMGLTVSDRVLTPEEVKAEYSKGPGAHQKLYWLTDYLDSGCILIQGVQVSRRELILYVCNKLGGAHFDPKRDTTKKLEEKFARLDSYRQIMGIGNRDAVHFELLSIVDSLQRSKDLQTLHNRLKILLR